MKTGLAKEDTAPVAPVSCPATGPAFVRHSIELRGRYLDRRSATFFSLKGQAEMPVSAGA